MRHTKNNHFSHPQLLTIAPISSSDQPSTKRKRIFEPTVFFYKNLSKDYDKLKYAVELICRFIRYPGPQLSVIIDKKNSGSSARIDGSCIVVQSNYKDKEYELGAYLANLITHAFINYNKLNQESGKGPGPLTELVSICLGLGKLVLNGFNEKKVEDIFQKFAFLKKSQFGNLRYDSLLYAYDKDRINKEILYSNSRINLKYEKGLSLIQKLIMRYRGMFNGMRKSDVKTQKKEYDSKRKFDENYFNCNKCGRTVHTLKSNYMGNERWICNSCGKVKMIERL